MERAVSVAEHDVRRRLLVELDTTFLVEAAAGTGKTSLLAGRIAMLLLAGREPRHIAAITFTELAAAELRHRIHGTVTSLLDGKVPLVLRPALPGGLSPSQRETLAVAADRFDELTITTIHGFCQSVIRMHAVTAGLDPGSQVVDAPTADGLFDAAFEDWLSERFSTTDAAEQDPIAVLVRHDPLRVVVLLRQLAILRREHPTAQTVVPSTARPDIDFVDVVAEFARWHAETPGETRTADLMVQLERLAGFYRDALDGTKTFAALWHLTSPPHLSCMLKNSIVLRKYDYKPAWVRRCGKVDGAARFDEARQHFERVANSYAATLGVIAQHLVQAASAALDGVLDGYARRKRAAAALDFDDLLLHARDVVAQHEDVRRAVAERYLYILVDEFQDTDPIQSEMLFLIAAALRPERWAESLVRPGALFLVGDPKQAIYRFRGADIDIYHQASRNIREVSGGEVIHITANFRSQSAILDHVNNCFAPVLSQPDQPGYVALAPTVEEEDFDLPRVAKLTLNVPLDTKPADTRDTEAEAVAQTCRRLIGAFEVNRPDGSRSVLTAGDIALLAPTGTELWRYERALEREKLTVASQAGKALMRRQETQDLLALARVLSDAGDTMAFGALMRGPLVGLTDDELVEITQGLSLEGPRIFSVRTAPEQVAHPLANELLGILQDLRRRAHTTTPRLLLSEAIERLRVRVVLAARHRNKSARAMANVDALIERASAYGVAGLQSFTASLQKDWEEGATCVEGRSDISRDAIEIVTMHSAKGLEWPVVIPINTVTRFMPPPQFVHRRSDNTLHWVIGGVEPPDLKAARAEEQASEARQRARLWYVACTRARDLLILPEVASGTASSWARILNLRLDGVPELEWKTLPVPDEPEVTPIVNEQTAQHFAEEAEIVDKSSPLIRWHRPSDHDGDRGVSVEQPGLAAASVLDAVTVVGAGRLRGVVLHKLMEEFLTGELADSEAAAVARAGELLEEVVGVGESERPAPHELGRTAHRTLHLPDVEALRPGLVPEVAVWGREGSDHLAARADALAVEGGAVHAVLDWKSDIRPTDQDRLAYAGQVDEYRRASGAAKAGIVYMTTGEVQWIALS